MRKLLSSMLLALAAMLSPSAVRAADPELPEGWIRADAITVPKGVYFDTGCLPSDRTRVAMRIKAASSNEVWFGARDADDNKGAFGAANDGANGGVYVGFGDNGGTAPLTDSDKIVPLNYELTVELNRGAFRVLEHEYRRIEISEPFSLTNTLYLFAENRKGTAFATQDETTCYGCQIYEDGVLVRNFVPCRSAKHGATAGRLYDTVEKKFYDGLNMPGTSGTCGVFQGPVTFLAWYKTAMQPLTLLPEFYTLIDESTTILEKDRYYVVKGNVKLDHGLKINDGKVHLILTDGSQLEIKAAEHDAGIRVRWDYNDELYIYGQTGGTGKLIARGGTFGAGIGGDADDYNEDGDEDCGEVYIHGGIIEAYGGSGAAGIGGAWGEGDGDSGDVTIYGGDITALGGNDAAGIGPGYKGEDDGDLEILRVAEIYAGNSAPGELVTEYEQDKRYVHIIIFGAEGKMCYDIVCNNAQEFESAIARLRTSYENDNVGIAYKVIRAVLWGDWKVTSKAHSDLQWCIDEEDLGVVLICNPDLDEYGHIQSTKLGGTITIDGNSSRRCLNLHESGYDECFFYGVTFANGLADDDGGGVYDNYNCTRSFVNCTFRKCKARDDGGGVYGGYDKKSPDSDDYLEGIYGEDEGDFTVAAYGKDYLRNMFTSSFFCSGDGKTYIPPAFSYCYFVNCTCDAGNTSAEGSAICPSNYNIFYYCAEDCTFEGCDAALGAVYKPYAVRRCRFSGCTSSQKDGTGCLYTPREVTSCLFVDCNCPNVEQGAAINVGNSGVDIYLVKCTFVNCKDKENVAVYDSQAAGDAYPQDCLFLGCKPNNRSKLYDDIPNTIIETFDEADAKEWFYDYGETYGYHIRDLEKFNSDDLIERKAMFYYELFDSVTEKLGNVKSLDGPMFRDGGGGHMVTGCYLYYTPQQWDDKIYADKPYEWEEVNPFVVTTTEDIVHPKDQKISFREACLYVAQHKTVPMGIADQWPAISFAMNKNNRRLALTNAVSFVADAATGALEEPVGILGGTEGVTLGWSSKADAGADTLLRMNFFGALTNVTFDGGFVACEHGKDPLSVPFADRKVRFVNCAFRGGERMAGVDSQRCVEMNRCTFDGCGDAATDRPALLIGSAETDSRIAGCTFCNCRSVAVRSQGDITLAPILSLVNCTFANNDPGLYSLDLNGTRNCIVNCIFADRADYARNFAALAITNGTFAADDPSDVLATVDPETMAVCGVTQVGFRPKHRGSARGGVFSATFDGRTILPPERDVFDQPQIGRYISSGSWYVDDREPPSIEVSTSEDIDDPYDDLISFREAIGYGAADPGSFCRGSSLIPIYSPAAFPDGKVRLVLTNAVPVASSVFKTRRLDLEPGEGQTLTFTTADPHGGLFDQVADTRLQARYVTFDACRNLSGDGGALRTQGWYRFHRCRFAGCETSARGGAIAATGAAQGTLEDLTFVGCKAAEGGAVFNAGSVNGYNLTIHGCTASGAGGAVSTRSIEKDNPAATLLACAALVDNVSGEDGAFAVGQKANYVTPFGGLISSIAVGNDGGDVGASATNAYSLTSGKKEDVFLGPAVVTDIDYGHARAAMNPDETTLVPKIYGRIAQDIYPLRPAGPASRKGAYVFVKTGGALDPETITELCYSEKADYNKKTTSVLRPGGKVSVNLYLLYDLTDTLIPADILPAMGPLATTPAEVPGSVVNTTADLVDSHDGATSLREAIDYVLENGGEVTFADGLFPDGKATFTVANQFWLKAGHSLALAAPAGKTLVLTADPADATRFFRVERGASLSLTGITLANGVAHGKYDGVSNPHEDENGGAVASLGTLVLDRCEFLGNSAPKGSGGAVSSGGTLTATDCTFDGNRALLDGGAIRSLNAEVRISGNWIANNRAGRYGGGIYINPTLAKCAITGTDVTANAAARGGGLFIDDLGASGEVTVESAGTRVFGNTAPEDVFLGSSVGGTFDGGGSVKTSGDDPPGGGGEGGGETSQSQQSAGGDTPGSGPEPLKPPVLSLGTSATPKAQVTAAIPQGVRTFALPTANGYAGFSVTVSKTGRAKVSGVMANGTKVSVSVKGAFYDGNWFAIPVKYAKKNRPSFSFVIWIDALTGESGVFEASDASWNGIGLSKGIALADGPHVAGAEDLGVWQDFTVAGKKWTFPKQKKKVTPDPNPTAMKLSWTAKTGVVKGTFKILDAAGRKKTFTVNGVVVDGVVHGMAYNKKIGTYSFEAR